MSAQEVSGQTKGGMHWRIEDFVLYLEGGDFIAESIMPWAPYRDAVLRRFSYTHPFHTQICCHYRS